MIDLGEPVFVNDSRCSDYFSAYYRFGLTLPEYGVRWESESAAARLWDLQLREAGALCQREIRRVQDG